MRDLHDGFAAWIAEGTRDELPRDLALHASGCEGCMRQAQAFDALDSVDLGAAPPPPVRATLLREANGPLSLLRTAGGALVVVLVLGAGAMTGSTLFGSRGDEPTPAPVAVERTPAEDVLSGVPSFTPSPTDVRSTSPSPSAEPRTSPSPSAEPDPTPAIAAAAPRPTMGGGPPPIATEPPATPAPVLATPQPAAPVTTPAPTIAPTPLPSPVASPTPTPTQAPEPTPSCDPVDPSCVPPPSSTS